MRLANSHNKPNLYNKRDKSLNNSGSITPLLLSCLAVFIILLLIYYSPELLDFEATFKRLSEQKADPIIIKQSQDKAILNCNLFKGRWVRDRKASGYKNSTCPMLPRARNCFLNGRTDKDFVNWRWKPHDCELPRFDAKNFLDIVRGKKLGFIGDSVSKNQMDSLLCFLSQEETPRDVYKDSDDGSGVGIWHFPAHDFTVMILRSNFLIAAEQLVINGSVSPSYNLHIDRVDTSWSSSLPTIDYVILSGGHWFFRPNYLYEGDRLVGCVFCDNLNITKYSVADSIRMAFQKSLDYINGCEECRGIVTMVRTFSPAHFENGTWNTGGICNRTSPFDERSINLNSDEWRIRNNQVKETEIAKMKGKKHGKTFAIIDVTKAMMMRPDGHPGDHWGNEWDKEYRDCVHWCLPGPIDLWNEFLMMILQIETGVAA